METRVTVLRLGHRPSRDKRVTTHVALVARAFGASGILVDVADPSLVRVVRGVVRNFGGEFVIETGVNWRRRLKAWPGTVVHLTMYGESVDEAIPRIPRGAGGLGGVGGGEGARSGLRRGGPERRRWEPTAFGGRGAGGVPRPPLWRRGSS